MDMWAKTSGLLDTEGYKKRELDGTFLMKIIKPKIPPELLAVGNFLLYSTEFREEEQEIKGISVCDHYIEHANVSPICLQGAVFKKCVFKDCDFEKSSFVDVIFDGCDFSNSNLKNTYLNRCEFISCKCIGMDICDSTLKDLLLQDSNFQYASFDHSSMNGVYAVSSDFTSALISEVKIKNFQSKDSQFIGTNFFKTALKSLDFTESIFAGIVVSDQMLELRGCIVNQFQTVDIAKMMGVIVKE